MQQAWHQFLLANGASLEQDAVVFPSDYAELPKLAEQNAICYLQNMAFLSISGPDSVKFLQGQLSCNLDDASPEHSILGSCCTPKGRMVTSFRLAEFDSEQIVLSMQQDIVENSAKVLGKYIVFSKAELSSDQGNRIALGLWGPGIKQTLVELDLEIPGGINDIAIQSDGSRLIQVDSDGQRFEWWLDAGTAESHWLTLGQSCQTRNWTDWQLLNIRAGIGHVEADTVEMFIPQMLNFQVIGAVSFNKGCYTGQEIVARMQYLGKLKRHMYRALISSSEAVTAGQAIVVDDQEQSIGNVVTAIRVDEDTLEALVVLTEEGAVHNNVHLKGISTAKLQMLSLPYAINNDT